MKVSEVGVDGDRKTWLWGVDVQGKAVDFDAKGHRVKGAGKGVLKKLA